ncbi:MAG: hypothetical protein NVS2B12_19290 [Ktedonobacteraceae bacterium]
MGQDIPPAHSIILTDKKKLHRTPSSPDQYSQADQWNRVLIDMSNEAMLICDLEHRILSWNEGATRLYGWSAQEAEGQISEVLLKARAPSSEADMQDALLQAGQWTGDIQYTHRAGHAVNVTSQRTLMRDTRDQPTVILEVHHALTDFERTERLLKTQLQQMMSFLERISDGFFQVNAQWRLTFVNQKAEQIVRRPREALLGQEVWDLFPDLVGTPFEEQARLAMANHQALQFEAQHQSTQRWFSIQLHPTPEGMLIFYNDITAYKRIEQALHASEARFQHLLVDANIVGLTITDENSNFLEANDAFLTMLGYTRADLDAHRINWLTSTPEEYRARDQEALAELFATGACKPYEKEFFDCTGARVPILMAGARLVDNTSRSIVALIVDMTAQKEVEKQRETFLSIVGHELRTPLTAISGSLQLAQRRLQQFLETTGDLPGSVQAILAKLDNLLEQSLRQTRVQDRLINDLLDISRLAVDKLELSLQPHDLVSVVRETVEDLRFTSSNHEIVLLPPPQATIEALVDPERIGQVVANYITNALKYSPSSAPVQVEMTVDADTVYVWVHDKGTGLTPEAQKHVWDRYYRTSDANDQLGHGVNLGLGLYICQVLIKRQHGQVGVNSVLGQGSSFWFSLPLLHRNLSIL